MTGEPERTASAADQAVRAFVALSLAPDMIEVIRDVQAGLKRKRGGDAVRWTRPEQLHLTLCFLGRVSVDRLDDLRTRLRVSCAAVPRFTLHFTDLGCFPNSRKPRILWVGFGGQLDQLIVLQRKVVEAVADLGDHSEEKTFQPHLTLGRVRPGADHAHALGQAISETVLRTKSRWGVARVDLMRSELSPQGARHTVLASFSLVDPAPPC